VRTLVKRCLRRLGLVVQRWPPRVSARRHAALALLRRQRVSTDVVIDVGANRGQWTSMARETFPDAVYHLVEPLAWLPAAAEADGRGVTSDSRARNCPDATGVPTVVMVGGGNDQAGTGNFIPTRAASAAADNPTSYPSTTLDALFGDLTASRLLLKLDVEGHELAVLEGARALLQRVEVIVSEFWMFRIDGEAMATCPSSWRRSIRAGFVLYDIGALTRPPFR
jgi:FkbM family methyltransferase